MEALPLNLPDILNKVEKAALNAGRFIKEEFGKIRAHQAEVKSLNSLVSYVDREAEKMIVEALDDLIEEVGYITEEDTTINQRKYRNWIIDPLDGTTNFLKGIPVFSVSIALTEGDEVMVGVVYDVMQDWCFSAYKGGGAFLNRQPISVSEVKVLDKAVIATGFPYERLTADSPVFHTLKNVIEKSSGIRRLGSAAIDLAYVSCGKVEGYYESGLNPWDLAAGILLVKEAGGIISDMNGGTAVLTHGSVIASNPEIHPQLENVLREHHLA